MPHQAFGPTFSELFLLLVFGRIPAAPCLLNMKNQHLIAGLGFSVLTAPAFLDLATGSLLASPWPLVPTVLGHFEPSPGYQEQRLTACNLEQDGKYL